MSAKPFLKWAGGKSQLLAQFESYYPQQLKVGKIKKYIEPFIGSGAVFFNVIQKYKIEESYIADINADLILTYKVIKGYVKELIEELYRIEIEFLGSGEDERQAYFYEMRDYFNELIINNYELYSSDWIKKAGAFIFLNRTCFNGLFRVNSKGKFNVPFGKYKNPKICDAENLKAVSLVLKDVNIYCGNYDICNNIVDENTFVYFDPPYRPIKQTSGFTSYSGEFTEKNQEELARFFKQLHYNTKAFLMLSNSDPKNYNTDDDYFDELFSGFDIKRVLATRMINSVSSSRGAITEILVRNYWGDDIMRYLNLSKEELANKFVEKLLITNRAFNFYVNWDNAESYKNFDVELHAMNVLIRCQDFDETFRKLLRKLPLVVATFPYLFALSKSERESVWRGQEELVVVNSYIGKEDNLKYNFSLENFSKALTEEQIEEYLFFFKSMGLKHLFLNLAESNIVDYVIGVLVGLDTNGRKNRGGAAFELACFPIIEEVCRKYDIQLLQQKQFKVLREFGFTISENVAERKADFILVKGTKCLNIEVNYYHGSGSKPEEIIDSYINRERDLEKDSISFALLTDGAKCWGSNTKSQLLKGFRNLKYLMNFNLAKEGMLEEVLNEVFRIK